ncbi:ACT domain-containing protein [Rhodohalobacter sp.]|uniref:ACT domain-containing protein n=1 Tax=Rhodohalobacter sp. TaxID=1974210 RepID=UPI002ACDA75D|nr:ACT domain-containing protein [Rhodohalobacter sp.]MDZ7757021.1 ACT domain-containing protein [Rhodohalobacter sp.]
MSEIQPSVSYSFTVRMAIVNKPGMLAKVLNVIAEHRGDPGGVDVVAVEGKFKVRDITVSARDTRHSREIVEAVKLIDGIEVRYVSDRVFLLHINGKISIKNKVPVTLIHPYVFLPCYS